MRFFPYVGPPGFGTIFMSFSYLAVPQSLTLHFPRFEPNSPLEFEVFAMGNPRRFQKEPKSDYKTRKGYQVSGDPALTSEQKSRKSGHFWKMGTFSEILVTFRLYG